MTFDGRWEARINVPSGVTVSATTDLGTSTVTIPTGAYFWTSAGGQQGLLSVIAQQLNTSAPRAAYPRTAGAMNAAVGYGNWTVGWLCDEASGTLQPVFGSQTFTPNGSPTYGNAGPRGGSDFAVGMPTINDGFTAGNVLDIGPTNDFIIAFVAKFTGTPGDVTALFSKSDGATGWLIDPSNTGTILHFFSKSGSVDATASLPIGSWFACIAWVDRTAGKQGIATLPLSSGSVSTAQVASDTTYANAATFAMGHGGGWVANGAAPVQISAAYAAVGFQVALGLSANISTAIQNFVGAINAAWNVSLSTGGTGTGQITATIPGGAIPPAWSIAWSSATSLRDIAGFTSDLTIAYPSTAAAMNAAVGYGTWTAGWLCDDVSGNLQPAFGANSFTPNGSPTYSNGGPRGGTDGAIGLGTVNDGFTLGNVYDIGATNDFAIAFVARFTSVPTDTTALFSKSDGVTGWLIDPTGSGTLLHFFANSGSTDCTASLSMGVWFLCIAGVDRGGAKQFIATLPLSGGAVSTSSTSVAASYTNAATFAMGHGGGWIANAAAPVQIAGAWVAIGDGAASGLSANISTAITSLRAALTLNSFTGTKQARALWLPDAPLMLASGEGRRAPQDSDLRTTTSPTGVVLGLEGSEFYQHVGLRYSHVPKARVWEQAATYANGSWETFFRGTQLGKDASGWLTPASFVQVYGHDGVLLGLDANSGVGLANGWGITGVTGIRPKLSEGANGWPGYWLIEIPALTSSG